MWNRPGSGANLLLKKNGSERYPATVVVNLKLERAIKISTARVIFSIDLFNAFNTNTLQYAEENAARSTYNDMRTIVSPRVFRRDNAS